MSQESRRMETRRPTAPVPPLARRIQRAGWALALNLAIGLALLLAVPGHHASAQTVNTVTYGDVVNGEVTTRLGEEWVFSGCLGDIVTITMQSDQFGSFLELYGPVGRDSLLSAVAEGSGGIAVIRDFTLPMSGDYTIIAAGSAVLDRGAYTLVLESASQAQDDSRQIAGVLQAGVPITGEITTRLADEWVYRGCQADVISATIASDAFTPYLEILGPPDSPTGTPASLVQVIGDGLTASLPELVLPVSGDYIIAAAGASIRDRGPYSLTVDVQARAPMTSTMTPTPEAEAPGGSGPMPTATYTPLPMPTPTPTRTSSPNSQPLCIVLAANLNLRGGPGLNYDPPLGALARGTTLVPLQRNANATWIRVQVVGGGMGWVSAGSQYISCNIDLRTLPQGVIPPTYTPTTTPVGTGTPTYTPTSTATPTKTPTPTQTTGGTPVASATPGEEPTGTPTLTPTATPTDAQTVAPTGTPDEEPSPTPTATATPTVTATATEPPEEEPSPTPTGTPTPTPTETETSTPTATPTEISTATPTATPTEAAQVAPPDANFNNPLDIPLDNTTSVLDFVSYPGGDNEDRVRYSVTGMNPNTTLSGGRARLVIAASCFGTGTNQVQFFTGGQTYGCGQTLVDREVTADSDTGSIVITAVGGTGTYVQWVLTGTATRVN